MVENKHIQHKAEPFNWSKYERTYNNAIDIVAQAIGNFRAKRQPIKAITLNGAKYDLFREGLRVLMRLKGQNLDEQDPDRVAVLFFDGVEIYRGSTMQFETMLYEFYPIVKPRKEK